MNKRQKKKRQRIDSKYPMYINEICYKYKNGVYLCYGFDDVCKSKGDCDNCQMMNEYIKYG